MDRSIALAALISALIPLTQGGSIGEEGGVRREPTVICSLKPHGRHRKAGDSLLQPYKQVDCLSGEGRPSTDNTHVVLPDNFNSNWNIISTRWRLPRKVSLFVMHVGYVTEDNTQSEECHLFNITGYDMMRKNGKRRLDCTYERSVSVTKSTPFNFTIVWGVENLPIAVGSFNKKTHDKKDGPVQRSVGCYDWRPQGFVLHPSHTDVKLTWSPAFTMSGLAVYLYDKENDAIIDYKEFKSWETFSTNFTEHTFHDVKARRYEGRIKPTGCKDCPDFKFDNQCSPDPVASEIVNKTDTEAETDGVDVISVSKDNNDKKDGPVQRSVGCYDWRPQGFVLHPSHTDVKLTWSPAFTMSGLAVYLYDKENDAIIDYKEFKSWETFSTNFTEHTFHDVKARRYEGRIKPTGCKDCPDFKFDNQCSPDPVASEIVNKADTEAETDGDGIVLVPKDNYLLDKNTLLKMAAATALAAFSIIIIMALMCYYRDYVCSTKALPSQPKSGPPIVTTRTSNKDQHHDGHRFRIVVLYGVDHFQHIAAVMAFASLLRKLLDVEVVVEREQGRADTCNIADWLTTSMTPPTIVIVVASEALYQLSCGQDARKRDLISRITGDMFAMYSPLALRYLQEENFSTQPRPRDVLLVSFGYQDTSLFKLMDSFRLLFKGVYFEVTEMKKGTRCHNITGLLRFLAVDGRVPDFTAMEEMESFLASVSRMDECIQVNGSAWWENIIDSSSYSSYSSGTSESRDNSQHVDLNIDTETFSVFSEVTASSAVTVNFLCKRCRVSSCHTLPSATSRLSPTLSDPQPAVWGSSCLTLHVLETDEDNTNDVFTPEASESTALVRSVVTLKNMDFNEPLNCDSCILIPEHQRDVFEQTTSSLSVEVAGREC